VREGLGVPCQKGGLIEERKTVGEGDHIGKTKASIAYSNMRREFESSMSADVERRKVACGIKQSPYLRDLTVPRLAENFDGS